LGLGVGAGLGAAAGVAMGSALGQGVEHVGKKEIKKASFESPEHIDNKN